MHEETIWYYNPCGRITDTTMGDSDRPSMLGHEISTSEVPVNYSSCSIALMSGSFGSIQLLIVLSGGIAAPDRLKGVESAQFVAGTNALTITTRPDQTQPSVNWSCVRFSKWILAEPSQMSRSKVSNHAGI